MPNWNYTDVVATGPPEHIDDLYNIMCSLRDADEATVKSDFDKAWYGCLIDKFGIDWNTVYCRGSWYDVEKCDENTLKWWDETAWGPLTEVFDAIEKHYPSVKIYWQCEEPGMGLYASNDIDHLFFSTMFILYYDDCDNIEHFDSEKELLDFVNSYLEDKPEFKVHEPIKTLEELDKLIEDTDDLAYYTYTYEE